MALQLRPKSLPELGLLASVRAFAVVGFFASLIQVAGVVPGAADLLSRAWGPTLLFIAAAAAAAGAQRVFQPKRVAFIARGTNLQIEVKIGDLLAESASVAIPVNDFFDTTLGTPVAPGTIHGQFLSRIYPNAEARARADIDAALSRAASIEVVQRQQGAGTRYPIGTTAVLSNRGHSYVLVALSETDAATCQVGATPPQFVSALVALWNQTRACCNHEPVSVPLMGAGASRTGLTKFALADFILATAIRAHQEQPITKKLTLVLRADDLREIDLFDLGRRYG